MRQCIESAAPSTSAAREQLPGRSVASGFLALALLPAAAVPAAAQFSAQPVIIEMETSERPAEASFTVRNEADSELQLQVYAADFDQPAGGGHEFMEPGEHPRSCVNRLRFFPDNLVVAPQGEAEVRVVMEPGASTCWSVIFVQNVTRQASGISISQRIGIKVYGVSDQLAADGEIRTAEVRSDASGARWLELGFENLGEGPLRPEGEIEIRTESGEIVQVLPVQAFSVLPGRLRQVRIPLELALEPGTYLAIPILDFGADYLAGAQAVFRMGPR